MAHLDRSRTALLIIDPQNDFLSEGGVAWELVGDGVKNTKVVVTRDLPMPFIAGPQLDTFTLLCCTAKGGRTVAGHYPFFQF